MFFIGVETINENLVLLWVEPGDLSSTTFVVSRKDFNGIVFV
jgi:hypothetical protein